MHFFPTKSINWLIVMAEGHSMTNLTHLIMPSWTEQSSGNWQLNVTAWNLTEKQSSRPRWSDHTASTEQAAQLTVPVVSWALRKRHVLVLKQPGLVKRTGMRHYWHHWWRHRVKSRLQLSCMAACMHQKARAREKENANSAGWDTGR